MSKLCPCCKDDRKGAIEATIFDGSGNPVALYLCREHDLELFKSGQMRFVQKYQIPLEGNLIDDVLNTDPDKVFADIA